MAGFELFEFHVGCNISDAWVGVDLGAGSTVNNVKCVRIFQANGLGPKMKTASSCHVRHLVYPLVSSNMAGKSTMAPIPAGTGGL